jgi:hypothetical protein
MTFARSAIALSAAAVSLLAASAAEAQVGGQWNWNTGSGASGSSWGAPSGGGTAAPATAPSSQSTDLEIGTLYVAAAAYGAGTGIWIDAEAGIEDPGLRFIAPAILGVGGPIGVYFLDRPPMRRGVPGAIAAGLSIGAGEGFGIWSYQFVRADKADAWGFKELARSTFIGATAGGVVGAAVGFTQEPSPKTSLLLGSGVLWGAGIGSMFGYGASAKDTGYGLSNDAAGLGGLIGYNAGLAATAGLSAVWIPTYKQLAFMWMGAGAGFAVTLPVYLFYAGSEAPAKRGLIVQGTGTTLGLVAGAIFTMDDKDDIATADPYGTRRTWAKITGVGLMPVPGGTGAQVTGLLF